MSTVCRNCRVRVQRLQGGWKDTPPSSGSRRRAPRALRPERGVTQSIPIGGLVATPWRAADRGNCKSDPEAKIAAFSSTASGRIPQYLLYRCNWLEARTGTALRLSPKEHEMT